MNKEKINTTYYIILIVSGLSFLIFTTLTVIFIFKSHVTINLSEDNSIINDTVIALTSIASAVLIYLGFKLQAKQMKISNDDKSFERYSQLIDNIPMYENKICIECCESNNSSIVLKKYGCDAIDIYLSSLEKPKHKYALTKQDLRPFHRNVLVYTTNVKSIMEILQNCDNEYLTILSNKLVYNIPELVTIIMKVEEIEDKIIKDKDSLATEFIDWMKELNKEMENVTKYINSK